MYWDHQSGAVGKVKYWVNHLIKISDYKLEILINYLKPRMCLISLQYVLLYDFEWDGWGIGAPSILLDEWVE